MDMEICKNIPEIQEPNLEVLFDVTLFALFLSRHIISMQRIRSEKVMYQSNVRSHRFILSRGLHKK